MGGNRFADPVHVDPFEQKAREHGLHYVHLQGSVGVIGNGAGLVMSSLDAISGAGEDQGTNVKPANFLDIGGGASAEVMCGSLEIALSDPQVESVLVKRVRLASHPANRWRKAFWKLLTSLAARSPLAVRFDGNAAAEGLRILAEANRVYLHVAQAMEEAAQQAAATALRPMARRFAER